MLTTKCSWSRARGRSNKSKSCVENMDCNWLFFVCVYVWGGGGGWYLGRFRNVLGWGLDLLAILQPFDVDVRINNITRQHNFLALFHSVAGFKLLQESWGFREKNELTRYQYFGFYPLLFLLFTSYLKYLSTSPPSLWPTLTPLTLAMLGLLFHLL